MKILQVPDDALRGIADYPFESHFVSVPVEAGSSDTLRIHYVDEGPREGRPVVFLHGNPGWSFIWREQVKAVAAQGFRAIAVDHVGMGPSDRPSELDDYTVQRHVDWLRAALFDSLDLRDLVFVLQDWGGILGLRLLALEPDRVAGVIASNTGFPERDPSEPLPPGPIEATGPFAAFQKMAREAPVWQPWTLLPMVTVTPLRDDVRAGYEAPYRDVPAIGSQAYPALLPTTPDNPMLPDNFEAWKTLERFDRPFVTIFSDKDVIAPEGWKQLVARIPGAKGQPHQVLEGGGHFLQEDIPEAYSRAITSWLRDQF
jgi:haloalkane dehalogenase